MAAPGGVSAGPWQSISSRTCIHTMPALSVSWSMGELGGDAEMVRHDR
jgi:hypothetical protein